MFVNSDNYIKYLKVWLITLFLLIILMVGVGGLTRLTDSGLSITAWELFTGILPPLNISDWNFYFSEYKKIPEYQNINYGMSLDEFKDYFLLGIYTSSPCKNCWAFLIYTFSYF